VDAGNRSARLVSGHQEAEGKRVRFRVTSRKSKLYHSDAVAERLGNAAVRAGGVIADDTDDEESESDAQLFIVRLAENLSVDNDRRIASEDDAIGKARRDRDPLVFRESNDVDVWRFAVAHVLIHVRRMDLERDPRCPQELRASRRRGCQDEIW